MAQAKHTFSTLLKSGLATAFLCSAFVVSPVFAPSGMSQANAQDARGNRERFEQCQDLKDAGRWNWSGIATGSQYGLGGRDGRTGFHIRSCHSSRKSCERWVRNVYREIRNIDTLRSARCVERR